MKYLTCEDYFSASPNILLTGMSEQAEVARLLECTKFIKLINDHLKFDNRVLCTAIHIFCTYARKYTFAEFNMYIACGMSHFIASKIEYKHPTIEFYEKFAHER